MSMMKAVITDGSSQRVSLMRVIIDGSSHYWIQVLCRVPEALGKGQIGDLYPTSPTTRKTEREPRVRSQEASVLSALRRHLWATTPLQDKRTPPAH